MSLGARKSNRTKQNSQNRQVIYTLGGENSSCNHNSPTSRGIDPVIVLKT